MFSSHKLKMSIAAGTAAAVMIAAFFPFESGRCLFFPSFIISACSQQEDDNSDDVTYSFAILDLFRFLFG